MSLRVTDYKMIPPGHASAVCIGNFDGFHLGHQNVARRCLEEAKRRQLRSILMTFHPHPTRFLKPNSGEPVLLFSPEVRDFVLDRLGFDCILMQGFDEKFSKMPASDFLNDVLRNKLNAQQIVVGDNFHFGHRAAGQVKDIQAFSNWDVSIVTPQQMGGEAISSTRIRKLVREGKVESAAECLGYDFVISGQVVRGDGRGAQLGFPTANIQPTTEAIPAVGVYSAIAVLDSLDSSEMFSAALNVGCRPTFDKKQLQIEAHLLNFKRDIYGSKIYLFISKRLRDEKKFDGIESLKAQIASDLHQTSKIELSRYRRFPFLAESGMMS